MTTIATLAVKLIADANAFISTMDQAQKKSQAWSDSVSKNMKEVGGNITNFGKGMTTFVTLPILAAGAGALKMASDLEETKNKVNVVFGSMSADVMEWSNDSATSMGLSQNAALSGAASFGNLFKTMGLGERPASDMSTNLVQLASDLGSFNNMDPTEVLQNLQSGLVGQSEPMLKFGVDIRDATVRAKALELGLVGLDGELSQAALTQARYALIMEQTATSHGDFANTSQGAANLLRTLQAQVTNTAGALGLQLLPYLIQAMQWFSGLITKFQALTPEQQKWIVVILAVVAAIGPLLIVVGSLVTAIGTIIGVLGAITAPILIVIAVIAALIAIGYLLYLAWTNNWGGIQEKTAAAIAFVQGLIASGMQFISDMTSGKLGAVSEIWNRTWSTIQLYFGTVVTNFKLILAAFTAAFHGDWYRFGELLRQVWDNSWRMIWIIVQTAWENIKTGVSAIVTNVVNFFKTTNWGEVGKNIVQGIANGITNSLSWIIDAARRAANAALQAAMGFLGIQSPSKVFEMQVGWQMAAGMAKGWTRGLGDMMPGTMQGVVPAVGSVSGMSAVGGGSSSARNGSIHITVQNRPLLSLGDRSEAEQVLKPMLLGMLRDLGVEVNR